MGKRGKQFVGVGVGNVAEESCRLSLQLSHAPDRDVKFDGLRNQRAGCRPDRCWSVRVSKLSRALWYGTLKPRHPARYQEHRTHSIEEAGRAGGGAVVRQPDVCPGGGLLQCALESSHYFPGQKERHSSRQQQLHTLPSRTPSHPSATRLFLTEAQSTCLPRATFDDRRPLPTPAHLPAPVPRSSSLLPRPPPRQRAQQEQSSHRRGSFIFQPSSCFTTTTPNRQPRDSCPPPPAWPPMGFRRTFPSPPSWPPSRRCRAQTPQRRRPPRTSSPSSKSRYVNVELCPSLPSVHPASNSSTERRMVRHNNDSAVVDGRSGADVRRDHAQGKGTTNTAPPFNTREARTRKRY